MYKLKKRFKNEKGQGMVEYGLILALVSIVAILGLSTLGGSIKGQFEGITNSMESFEPGKVPGDSDEEIEVPEYSDEDIEKIDDLIDNNFIPVVTADELNNVRSATLETYGKGTKWEGKYTGGLDKKYIQVADINLSKFTNFEPIGTESSAFTGTFDGGGYVISNLKISRESEDYVGLFGQATGATFKNVGLEDVNVTGGSYVGGLVGSQSDSSTVTDSYATGSVNGTGNYTGGLVGRQYSSSTVTNSYATGPVTGIYSTGGLVGDQYGSSTVRNSYATGEVTGANHTGGLVGWQSGSSTVRNSYATGSVTGTENNVGGLVGYQQRSSVTNSYVTGNVTGTGSRVGGLVGRLEGSSTVTNSYATGSVNGAEDTGGLVGHQSASSVKNSYATGEVTGGSNTGGLVGRQYGSSVSRSYYDTETTGQSDTGKGEGKTTAEMKNKNTYKGWDGWDNTIWTIENNQYPTLR